MRKLVVTTLMSLDGYAAGPGGDVMMLPLDESFSNYNLERLRAADTLLLGRTTFEGFRQYWPPIADDTTEPETEREISRRNTAARKVVVSDTLDATDTAGWGETFVIGRAEAAEAVRRLKQQDGADILVFGSVKTYNALLAAGVVDEVHVMVAATPCSPTASARSQCRSRAGCGCSRPGGWPTPTTSSSSTASRISRTDGDQGPRRHGKRIPCGTIVGIGTSVPLTPNLLR